MKQYFLISEFAKLRGININSLRYYEKLGLLKPAYVDEKTNYRYYSAEQLTLLNKIIMCVQLGIPLKEMSSFIDEKGELQSQKLLEKGKIVAQKRMIEMENNLKYIETSLKKIEENKVFAGKEGVYCRRLEERKIIMTDAYRGEFNAETANVRDIVSEVSKIYKEAQKKDYFPVLPAGLLLNLDEKGEISVRFFLEVLNCREEQPNIKTLPAGEYSCIQTTLEPDMNLIKIIQDTWKPVEPLTVIIDNIVMEKYSFKSTPSELRTLKKGVKN